MLQFVPHLQGIFGTILPAKISKNKLKMSATITTSGILCSWALEANLKWNTNVLAEWLDMDLNRKRKRKHYFQYGQVAGGGGTATEACAMGAWKPQPMSSSQARRRLELSPGRERSAAATSMSWQASNANCIPNACVSHKKPQKLHRHRGKSARQAVRQAGKGKGV